MPAEITTCPYCGLALRVETRTKDFTVYYDADGAPGTPGKASVSQRVVQDSAADSPVTKIGASSDGETVEALGRILR